MAANSFESAYLGTPPWDIGRPQPAIVRLAESNQIAGSVLDVGCGTGENILYLAERGLSAAEVVKQAAAVVGGGGGGRDTMAQAGGRDPDKLEQALAVAREAIEAKLA